jgi:hypothetical protein
VILEGTPFLVDGFKHRIVKRGGMWRLYCPKNGVGPKSLVIAYDFEAIRVAMTYPCRYQQSGETHSHLVPVASLRHYR